MLKAKNRTPRFDYGDYQQWIGDERWELFEGEPYLMSPAPSRRHQEIVGDLLFQIRSQLAGHRCRVYVAPFDVRLPEGKESGDGVSTVVQPDLSVFCDPAKLDEAGACGAPDWVIEVLSPATEARDRELKRDLYQRHGVREYWLVDPDHATLLIYRLGPEGQFDLAHEGAAPERSSCVAVPAVSIEWPQVLG